MWACKRTSKHTNLREYMHAEAVQRRYTYRAQRIRELDPPGLQKCRALCACGSVMPGAVGWFTSTPTALSSQPQKILCCFDFTGKIYRQNIADNLPQVRQSPQQQLLLKQHRFADIDNTQANRNDKKNKQKMHTHKYSSYSKPQNTAPLAVLTHYSKQTQNQIRVNIYC